MSLGDRGSLSLGLDWVIRKGMTEKKVADAEQESDPNSVRKGCCPIPRRASIK